MVRYEDQDATLTPSGRINDPIPQPRLGWSSAVSEDGSTIVLAPPGISSDGTRMAARSAAYVYMKPMGGWAFRYRDGEADPRPTGACTTSSARRWRASSNGSTVIAGTRAPSTGSCVRLRQADSGRRDGRDREREADRLRRRRVPPADFLGSSLAISSDGSTIVAGATTATISATQRGAVYVIDKPPAGWVTASRPRS